MSSFHLFIMKLQKIVKIVKPQLFICNLIVILIFSVIVYKFIDLQLLYIFFSLVTTQQLLFSLSVIICSITQSWVDSLSLLSKRDMWTNRFLWKYYFRWSQISCNLRLQEKHKICNSYMILSIMNDTRKKVLNIICTASPYHDVANGLFVLSHCLSFLLIWMTHHSCFFSW